MVAIAEIKDRKSFEAWLEDKPVEWARVLATRSALRILPFALLDPDRVDTQKAKVAFQDLTLSAFRATLISRVANVGQSDQKHQLNELQFPASAASDAAHSRYYPSGQVTIFIENYVVLAAGEAVLAAHMPLAANPVGYAATSVDYTIAVGARVLSQSSITKVIQEDCKYLVSAIEGIYRDEMRNPDFGQSSKKKIYVEVARELIGKPLWLDEKGGALYQTGMPDWVEKRFDAFANSEFAQETSFGLIVDWYRDICLGRPNSVFKGETDYEVARQGKEFWEGDPVEVMDRVAKIAGWERRGAKRVDEASKINSEMDEGSETLPAPSQGSGPSFGAKNGELSRLPMLPTADEAQSPSVQKLLDRLKKRLELFLKSCGNQLGRFPALSAVLDDYKSAIEQEDAISLDVHELWMSGAGLISQARSFAALDPEKQVTEPLEPEAQALLGEMARLHGALVMSFSEGRLLAEQSGVPLLSSEDFAALLQHEKDIVRWLLLSDQYELSDSAKEVFEQIDRYMINASDAADQIARIVYPSIRNLLIFTANALEYVDKIGGRLSMAGVPTHLLVGGALYFLRDNFSSIMAFVNSVPELRGYLEYHLKRLEIEYQSDIKTIDNQDDEQ